MSSSLSSLTMPMRIFFSGHEQTEKNHACGPGLWPHYLLHFVLRGTGTFTSAGRVWKLSAGDAFLIIPGIVCSYKSSDDTPWEYCWIGFDGRDVKSTLNSCGLNADNPVFLGAKSGGFAGAAGDGLSDAAGRGFPAPEPPVLAPGRVLLSLNEMMRAEPDNGYLHLSQLYQFFSLLLPGNFSAQKDPSDYLHQAIDYIQHNYAYDIQIQDVARHVGIDRTYLYKIFTREMGTSPQQYLINYRLSMAKQLLSSTTLRIAEISNSCGFTDSAAFCHQFRKQFQLTPSQFRREPVTEQLK